MPRSNRHNRFTIYDMMDVKGSFSSNPANSDSVDPTEGTSLYQGPVQFPKMFYHPEAKFRILNPGEVVSDLLRGPVVVGELREMIWEIAQTPEDAKRLQAAGWHDHPAKALAANGLEAPAISSQQTISELEAKVAEMQAEIDRARQVAKPEAEPQQPELVITTRQRSAPAAGLTT